MELARARKNAFMLTVSAVELSSLMAAVRLAVDVLERDAHAPAQAVGQLRRLLSDYERAASRITGERDGRE